MELFGLYFLIDEGNRETKSFNTAFQIVCKSSSIDEIYDNFASTIFEKAGDFLERKSGMLYFDNIVT